MISRYFKGERNRGIRILALSIFFLLFIFSIYAFRYSTIPLGASPTQYLVAQIVIMLTVVCISFGVYGIFHIIRFSNVGGNKKFSLVAQLNSTIGESYQFKLAILSSILYGLFFAFLSKIIIYIPNSSLSAEGLSFPSVSLALCCGAPGYFPMATLRLTENFSILFIPLNIVIAVFLSVLVGLNVALIVHYTRLLKSKDSRKISGISSLGAFAGLFIACPTCSGGILFTVLGIGGGTSALVLAPFQSLFILMSLPILILTPFLMVHKMKKSIMCEPEKKYKEDLNFRNG